MKKIVLASTSPRRKALLEQIGLKFEIVPSDFEEDYTLPKDPKTLIKYFAREKALSVSKKALNTIVIGADTIVIFKNKIYGKPKNKRDAFETLKKFSGQEHIVATAYTIMDRQNKKEITRIVSAKVKFRKLNDSEIRNYIKREHILDKAGSYAIQDLGALLIEKISGDYYTIIGLPLNAISQDLKKFKISTL